jgi:hypothetical protein
LITYQFSHAKCEKKSRSPNLRSLITSGSKIIFKTRNGLPVIQIDSIDVYPVKDDIYLCQSNQTPDIKVSSSTEFFIINQNPAIGFWEIYTENKNENIKQNLYTYSLNNKNFFESTYITESDSAGLITNSRIKHKNQYMAYDIKMNRNNDQYHIQGSYNNERVDFKTKKPIYGHYGQFKLIEKMQSNTKKIHRYFPSIKKDQLTEVLLFKKDNILYVEQENVSKAKVEFNSRNQIKYIQQKFKSFTLEYNKF